MKKIFIWLLLQCCSIVVFGNIVVGSWNLQNLGKKKTDSLLAIAARCLKDMDVVALQEVSISGGVQTVGRLVVLLNRTGADWDYVVSDPTTAANPGESERYAILWKKNKMKFTGKSYLATVFAEQISREPFIAVFRSEGKEFSLVCFHAVPKKKQPETEIKYLKFFPDSLKLSHPVFLGDFNCPETHTVFNPLKKNGYKPALTDQKTTLKQACRGDDCLASAYDNIFYPVSFFTLKGSGIIPFHTFFQNDMIAARKLSDHVPVYAELHFH